MKKTISITAAVRFATKPAFVQVTVVNNNGNAADNPAMRDGSNSTKGTIIKINNNN